MRFPLIVLATLSIWAAEPYRPLFHFSPARNWTNDPCGLFFKDGQYHLFFQYNPEGDQWGHMSWGHAVSSDLLHWTQLPVAVPEGQDAMIFTGSSVVERSGRIASIYTGHRPKQGNQPAHQNQNIAFSSDGRSWTKYPDNPVLDIGPLSDFRDPKVFWHAPTKKWVMVVMLPLEHKASFYGSGDLVHWTHLSDYGPAGVSGYEWECPDFFELPVQGDPKETRWILKIGLSRGHIAGGSGEQYFIGRFDGTRFLNDSKPDVVRWLDYGPDCYCEFSFSNTPAHEPPVALGWMSNWLYAGKIPTSPWRGQMTMARTYALRQTAGGLKVFQAPVSPRRGAGIAAGSELPEAFEIAVHVKTGNQSAQWTLLDGLEFGYDAARRELFLDRTHAGNTGFDPNFGKRYAAPVALDQRELDVRLFADRSSVEMFALDGEYVFTALVFPRKRSKLEYSGPPAETRVYRIEN